MQRRYWSDWKRILDRWGLKLLTCTLLDDARPVIPFIHQVMLLGLPFFRGLSTGAQYSAVLDTLNDDTQMDQFSDFLQEAGV